MIEKKLEMLLITYNRSKDLENTFKQLIESPFANCKITVFDNCSTDDTPNICAQYQNIFPNIKIIRHRKNIGANPNILRAVETSESLYTWVLCDDDNYDFSDCSDVIECIKSEDFDLIIVTSHYQSGWEKGLITTSNELIEKGSNYYHTLSFVPAIIFKTDLFDSYCVHKGYFNVQNQYPHFEFINKSVENNFSVYVSKNEIVQPGMHNSISYSALMWITSWLKSCSTIKDKKIRKKAIFGFSDQSFVKRILYEIILEKSRVEKPYKSILSLALAFIMAFEFDKIQLLLLIIVPLAFIPSFPLKIVRKYKNRDINYQNTVDYDHYRI